MTDDNCPIFLSGASRSGTALVRSILNNAPGVHLAGETHYFDDLRAILGDRAQQKLMGEDQRRCEDYFMALAHRPYGHGGVPEESPLDRMELRALAQQLGGTGDDYFEAHCRIEANGRPRWGEKTPRHIFRLNELLNRYPRAQAICMVRDARAVVTSYRDWKNQGGFDFDDDPGHKDTLVTEQDRAKKSYHIAIASMLWRSTVGAALEARRVFGANRVWIQRYEDLVTDPASTARPLIEWLGLDWDEKLLDVPMHNSSVSDFSASGGVMTDPMDRWRSKLSPSEMGVIDHFCGPTLLDAGYERSAVSFPISALLGAYITLPVAVLRAARANRDRIPSLPRYLWRRLRLLSSS
jgi:Sulfotransferase family